MLTVVGVLLLSLTHIRGGTGSQSPSPFWGIPGPVLVYQRPIEAMVDVTNDLGVAVLQDFAYTRSNFAFSPYGVASVLVVLYEGARGESARQIHNTLRLPWNRDITRIGFRDIHRHLRSYFSHEGYLSGLTLNKNQTSLLMEYRRVLRFYGYDVGTGQGDQFPPTTTTKKPTTTTTESTTIESTTENVETQPATSTENMQTTTMDPRNMVAEEETTTEAAATSTSPPQEIPETTTEDIIPPARTTEDSIPSTTTTRGTTTEEGVTLITLTIPRETTPRPVADEPSSMPPMQDEPTVQPEVTSTSVPETTTNLSPKEMPEDTMKPVEETPAPTEQPEVTMDTTESPEVPMDTTQPSEILMEPTGSPEVLSEAPSLEPTEDPKVSTKTPDETTTETPTDVPTADEKTTESPTDVPTADETTTDIPTAVEKTTESPALADEPVVETMTSTELPEVETFVPTEAPEEKVTVGPTEPEAEIISTMTTVEPTTGSSTELSGQTSTLEIDNTLNTRSPDAENTIPEGSTAALSTTEETTTGTAESEALTESMSEIVDSRVKFDVPIPLVYNQSETSSVRIKRSVSDISLQLQNGMFDSQVARGYELYTQLPKRPFLVDGVAEELVPVMSYTALFPFAYIRRLHAQALEFPLDDERYKLLLLLPLERRGLRQLIYDLSSCPLREIYQAMRPTRVQAIIPSFMVEGFVILTPTLQQLGIWDVFDPRRANLSGMSNDPDLYVRNIEQAVTVVIRNYVKILDIQTRTMAARATLERFVVTHPFLYFVMDTDTHVALMAGKIVDPMNSRIY